MNKIMLLGGAALLALSGAAIAQEAAPNSAPANSSPSPDMSTPAPAEAPDVSVATPASPAVDTANATPTPTTTAPAADAAATTTASAAPAATTPADSSTTATASAAGSATPPAVNADAAAKVNAEWAKYDEGNKGKLTPLEFGNWVLAAKGQDQTAQVDKTKTSKKANLPAVKVLNETAADFAKADTDKDKAISPNELASFLSA